MFADPRPPAQRACEIAIDVDELFRAHKAVFEERLAAFEKEYAAGRKRREARAAALRAVREEQEAVKAGKRKPCLTNRRKRPGKGWGWVDQEQVGSGPGADGVDVQDDVPGWVPPDDVPGWVPPDVYKELKDTPTWTPEEPSPAKMFAALALLHDEVLPTEPPILDRDMRESEAIRSLRDKGEGNRGDFDVFSSGSEFTYSGVGRMREYLYAIKAELTGRKTPRTAAVSFLMQLELQPPPPTIPGDPNWLHYDWLCREAAILKRGYFDARERCERYSRIPDGADAEKGAVEKKLHSVDRWEDLERRRLRLAERCRAWMPDVAEALPEMSRPRDERLDQGATEGELRKIEIEACSRFDADLETRSGQYPVSRALNRLRANLNLALLQFLLIGEEDGKYPTDNACAEYRDAHARAREICRRGQALPALPAPVNDPQRDLRGLYDWCGDAMARWRLSKPTDAEDAPAAAAPEQGEGKAGSLVPILCPYDGPLAAALRRRCPDVKEAHDELGSLRDYKQALFVQSLPVIMEWPPDPWFDLPEGAEPRPCAWDRLLFEAPAEDEQGEDTSPLAAFMKHARRLPEQPPEYTENILWDSQPVASFAAECQRAGKPLALGQWSDPLRIGRAWGSQTGFLEQHQHGDLASGIVQGRFIAVAFVDRVLVDPRFRQWCVLWEEYRKTGEVPVLAHEKAARDIGAAIPERKTVWDHLPYVIGLNCPILYTAAALHYLLPVKGDAVEYGPVCSDGVAFDFNRVGIGEAIRNPRQAEGVNWLSDDAMKLFGLAEVMVRAAGSESAVAKMYGITAAEVSVLPLVTSQAGDPLGVAFKIGQGGVLVLPGCWSLMAKADMIRRLASDFWAPMRQWLRDTGEPAVRGGDSSNARKAEEPKEEPPQEERGPANCFLPRGHFWEVRYGEEEGHLKASKGMQRIYQLLRQRDNPKPVSALALVGADEELAKLDQTFEPILDRKAKAAFRDEIASLDSRIEVAEQNDDASAAHLREERGKIVADFMNAHGLGRRDRKLGSASPAAKAANAVRTTLARTYGVMRKADPPMKALAAHLSESIQSEGNAFAYRPAPETSAWDL